MKESYERLHYFKLEQLVRSLSPDFLLAKDHLEKGLDQVSTPATVGEVKQLRPKGGVLVPTKHSKNTGYILSVLLALFAPPPDDDAAKETYNFK